MGNLENMLFYSLLCDVQCEEVSQEAQQHSPSSFLPTGVCGSAQIHRAGTRINDCRGFTSILVFVGQLSWVQSEILTQGSYTNTLFSFLWLNLGKQLAAYGEGSYTTRIVSSLFLCWDIWQNSPVQVMVVTCSGWA